MNLLKYESSPYLLQHAENPVHWMPWGEEAFQRARDENKPVLISIGYSSCHWCHVMEHESFENDETAALMNQLFVNIKVDREEYPDVDHMYMDAVQAMTGSGGWPLNVFVTPDKKAFYGGTYFPRVRAHGRASWKEVLINVSQYFSQNRNEVEAQAGKLQLHLEQSGVLKLKKGGDAKGAEINASLIKSIATKMLTSADRLEGGFGAAPKFPSTFCIRFLLDQFVLFGDEEALSHATLSLDKMMMGGIYDQAGGGFARYSTDRHWIAPHFEKMLYDNALLIEVYSIAYAITKKAGYKEVIAQTVKWLCREMMTPDGGFYSAQDADSEGVEGKYYTWSYEELKEIVNDDFSWFSRYYHIKPEGNWEHTNILYTTYDQVEQLSDEQHKRLDKIQHNLLSKRGRRIPPLTDDKILLGWNALMNKALVTASLWTGESAYLELAEKNMNFLLDKFKDKTHLYYHSYRDGKAKIGAFLDDLAYLADALIWLGIVKADITFVDRASEVLRFADDHFLDKEDGLYCFTHRDHTRVAVNKKEVYDGAQSSPNAVMLGVKSYLARVYQQSEWASEAEQMLGSVKSLLTSYPNSFANWAGHLQRSSLIPIEVSLVGVKAPNYFKELYTKQYNPVVTYINTQRENTAVSLQGKYKQGESLIYICKNFSCLQPLGDINDAFIEISKKVE